MTGFEYSTAVHMIYEGLTQMGLACIAAIRERYDGRKRSPFDEAECGHHYARAMASWAAVLALTGFHYSAVAGKMSFAARAGTHFWSTGRAWGTCTQVGAGEKYDVTLDVMGGQVSLRAFELTGVGGVDLDSVRKLQAGQRASWRIGRAVNR
jgi:hypothetical protein